MENFEPHDAEENLDVLDEAGNFVKVLPRSQVHKEGLWHRTIHVWIINSYD